MNTRQKKKQYKKRYGHNPPRGADGRYLFHVTYGLDLAAGQDHSETLTPEQVEELKKIQALTPENAERIRNSFCEAAAIGGKRQRDRLLWIENANYSGISAPGGFSGEVRGPDL